MSAFEDVFKKPFEEEPEETDLPEIDEEEEEELDDDDIEVEETDLPEPD